MQTESFSKFFKKLEIETIVCTSTKQAELVKLFSNVYRDLSFGIANLFDEIASIYDINGTKTIDIANYKYSRNNIAKPGSVAGPCLSKDAILLAQNIDNYKIVDTINMGRELNSIRIRRYCNLISSKCKKK